MLTNTWSYKLLLTGLLCCLLQACLTFLSLWMCWCSCLSVVLLNTGGGCHEQSAVFLTSSMHHEFPTILSPTETKQTQHACPSGLSKAAFVLFGITSSTFGNNYWAEILQWGDNYLASVAREDDVTDCSFVLMSGRAGLYIVRQQDMMHYGSWTQTEWIRDKVGWKKGAQKWNSTDRCFIDAMTLRTSNFRVAVLGRTRGMWEIHPP